MWLAGRPGPRSLRTTSDGSELLRHGRRIGGLEGRRNAPRGEHGDHVGDAQGPGQGEKLPILNSNGAALDSGFPVLPRLAGRMDAFVIPDFLMDIGTPESYRKAESEWPGL